MGFAGDARGGERGGVGDGDVAVDAIEECGMAAGNFVEILARGQNFFCPESVIPVAAGEPVAGGCCVGGGLDLREHVGERFDAGEVDVELGAACAAKVCVGVVESGKDDRYVVLAESRSCKMRLGSGEAGDFVGRADGENFAAADGDGFDDLRLVFSEANAGVDDAVEKDDVG